MILDNIDNLISFGYSILTGIISAVVYDSFRAFRYTSKARHRLKYSGDIVYWLFITIFFFIIMVKLSDGILRGFLFIGFFSGGLLYFLTASEFIFYLFLKIFKLIFQSLNEIMGLIKRPFVKLKIKSRFKKILLAKAEMKAQRKKHWKIIRGKKPKGRL